MLLDYIYSERLTTTDVLLAAQCIRPSWVSAPGCIVFSIVYSLCRIVYSQSVHTSMSIKTAFLYIHSSYRYIHVETNIY